MKIKCGKWNWKLIFPFIYSASLFSRSFSSNYPSNNPFLPLILLSLSQLSIGLQKLFSFCYHKIQKDEDEEYSVYDELNNFKLKKKKEIIILCLLGFINLYVCHFLLLGEDNNPMKPSRFQRETIIYGMIIFYIINLCMYSYYKGRHFTVSSAIFIFTAITFTIMWFLLPFKLIPTSTSTIIIHIILFILFEAFFVAKHIIEQKIISNLILSPYCIVFYEGIGSLIGLVILLLLYDYIGCFGIFDVCSKEEYIHPLKYIISSFKNYKYILIFLPCSIIIELFIIITVKYLSIMERSVFNMLFALVRLICNMNNDIEIYGWVLFVIIIILCVNVIFWDLVFLERIEVLFCQLDRDIYKPKPEPPLPDDYKILKLEKPEIDEQNVQYF